MPDCPFFRIPSNLVIVKPADNLRHNRRHAGPRNFHFFPLQKIENFHFRLYSGKFRLNSGNFAWIQAKFVIFFTRPLFIYLQDVTSTRPLLHANVHTMYLPWHFIIHERSCVDVTSCGLGGNFKSTFPFFAWIQATFAWLQATFAWICLTSGESVLNSGESCLNSGNFRQLLPEFRRKMPIFCLYFLTVLPDFRHFQANSPEVSWLQAKVA